MMILLLYGQKWFWKKYFLRTSVKGSRSPPPMCNFIYILMTPSLIQRIVSCPLLITILCSLITQPQPIEEQTLSSIFESKFDINIKLFLLPGEGCQQQGMIDWLRRHEKKQLRGFCLFVDNTLWSWFVVIYEQFYDVLVSISAFLLNTNSPWLPA